MYCVYKITYLGKLLPKYYIGSTSVSKISSGYLGSVTSRKYKTIWKKEIKENRNLFVVEILSVHEVREDATAEEKRIQIEVDAVQSNEYVNEALASPNGYFGRDVKGKNNPMFGKRQKDTTKEKISKIHKNKKLTVEQKFKISDGLKNMYLSDVGSEKKMKNSIALSGKNNGMFGRFGENNPNFGRKNTEESNQKISNALTGKIRTEEHCKNLSRVYEIEMESGERIIGYGLLEFCNYLNINVSSLMYSIKSNKFFNGFKIIERLGINKNLEFETDSILNGYFKLKEAS